MVTSAFEHKGFSIAPIGKKMEMSAIGEPKDVVKLRYNEGVRIDFPDYTESVMVHLNNYSGRTVYIVLLKDGVTVFEKTEIVFNSEATFNYSTMYVNTLVVKQDKNFGESAVIKVCIGEAKGSVKGDLTRTKLNVINTLKLATRILDEKK